MIDHIGFPVSDYERAKSFYLTALAPLDYALVMEVTQEQTGHDPTAGFGANGKPDFWIGGEGGLNKAAACRDRRQRPRHRRCVLQGRHGGRRARQRRAWNSRALSSELLRRLRTRPRWPQHRGGLPHAGMTVPCASLGVLLGFSWEHRGISSVIADADRTSRNPAPDAGTTDRAAAGRSSGQPPAGGAAADARARCTATAPGIAGQDA